jgi:hypothetical protein
VNESEQYVFDAIKTWVKSGFYTLDDIYEMMEDIIEEECDEDMLQKRASEEFLKKQQSEDSWPNLTDCDRLDFIFNELNELGIIALQNTGYTMSDGFDDVGEVLETLDRNQVKGYCFYHGQDLERALADEGLTLAFGDLNAIDDQKIVVGKLITEIIKKHHFEYIWDGTANKKINIFPFKWQRRHTCE